MASSIKATVLHGAKDLRIASRILESPGNDEVQIAIRSTGLCGSDLHYYTDYRNGDILVCESLTLGHESTGIVVAVGKNVTSLSTGDSVALEVSIPWGECELCAKSRYNICQQMRFRSSAKSFPHAQGTLQERINHPAKWCHRLPHGIDLSVGALLEPLSVAIHATNRAASRPQAAALVVGAGPIGLLVAAMSRKNGARATGITDVDQGRIDFAVKHRFADQGVLGSTDRTSDISMNLQIAQGSAAKFSETLDPVHRNPGAFDVVFECSGIPACLEAAIYATRPGGKVMMVGMGSPIQTLSMSAAALREVDLCGVFRYANTYPTAIKVLSMKGDADSPDFPSLITHTFNGLDASGDALPWHVEKTTTMGTWCPKSL